MSSKISAKEVTVTAMINGQKLESFSGIRADRLIVDDPYEPTASADMVDAIRHAFTHVFNTPRPNPVTVVSPESYIRMFNSWGGDYRRTPREFMCDQTIKKMMKSKKDPQEYRKRMILRFAARRVVTSSSSRVADVESSQPTTEED